MCSTILCTHTVRTESRRSYRTYWKTEQQTGIVETRFTHPQELEDELILAEAWALRELLIEKSVCGEDRTGENLTIELTHGAIRKVMRNNSAKRHLLPHMHWLLTRFADARINVIKKAPWAEDIEASLRSESGSCKGAIKLVVTPDSRPGDFINVPGVGEISITRHAIERYQQRTGIQNKARAWRQIRRLIRQKLTPAQIPEAVLKKKKMKYGCNEAKSAVIMNSINNWQLVFADHHKDPERYSLVTIYQRPGVTARQAA